MSQDGKALLDVLQRPLSPGNSDSLTATANYSKAVGAVVLFLFLQKQESSTIPIDALLTPELFGRFIASWMLCTRSSTISAVWRISGSTERSDCTRGCSCACSSKTSSRYAGEPRGKPGVFQPTGTDRDVLNWVQFFIFQRCVNKQGCMVGGEYRSGALNLSMWPSADAAAV